MKNALRPLVTLVLSSCATLLLPVYVHLALADDSPTITTNTISDATATTPYTQAIQVTGGTGPYSWMSPVSLPEWLSIDPATGMLSGTPPAQSYQSGIDLSLQVTDAVGQSVTRDFNAYLHPFPTVTTYSVNDATLNYSYQAYLGGIDGTYPYIWSIASGSLPPGISIVNGDRIAGIPTDVGAYTFVLQLTDANGAVATQSVSMAVTYAPPVISSTLADATINAVYAKTIGLKGGFAPFTWSILAGSLPTGFSLAPATGVISGSPTSVGSSSFIVQVQDNASTIATRSLTLTIQPTPVITTTNLPDGGNNTPYAQMLQVSGGAAPFTWSLVSGSLPSGVHLSSSGMVSGRPTTTESSSFTVRATGTNGISATQSLSLTINQVVPNIATETLEPTLANGSTYYSQTLQTDGGTGPYTWSVASGNLPYGLSLDEATGILSGVTYPDIYGDEGIHHFIIQVTDANNESDTQDLSLTIYGILRITTTNLPDATIGVPYDHFIEVSGGLAPYVWESLGASLPAGLSLNGSTGQITGTPSEPGVTNLFIRITDGSQSVMDYVNLTVLME